MRIKIALSVLLTPVAVLCGGAACAQSAPAGRDGAETFCSVSPAEWESTKECVSRQRKFNEQIESWTSRVGVNEARDGLSQCSGFTTGGRGLGSAEALDSALLARCVKLPDRKKVFQRCVVEVTGREMHGSTIHWRRQDSDAIANCFNSELARLP